MSSQTPPPRDPLAGFAPGHPAVARLVLESLRTLARSGDPDTRRWAGDVLAGRRSVRDVPQTETMRAAAEADSARLSALDDDTLATLAERGRAIAEDLIRRGSGRGPGRG